MPDGPPNALTRAVIAHWARKPMPDWSAWILDPTKGGKLDPGGPAKYEVAAVADAKLTVGVDAARVNQVLRSAAPYSGVGTHFTGPAGLMRKGDYDFALTGLTALLYRHWDNPLLEEATKRHLATVVLNQEGAEHMGPRWGFGLIPETENHVLMTESARYLKNQLVHRHGLAYAHGKLPPEAYDNEKNGFNAWLIQHLSTFLREDFDEYNSRPYQRCSMKAIQNLAEFAEDPAVRTAAQAVLDYMATRFALGSSEFRRVGAFRRRKENGGADDVIGVDSEAARYAMLLAERPGFPAQAVTRDHLEGHDLLHAATLGYRPPAAVAALMLDKAASPHFSQVRHRNTEIHHAEASFMIAAGGHHARFDRVPIVPRFWDVENAIVMPTTVWLKGSGSKLSDAIRFLGRGDGGPRNDTGVYENFACGIRPVIPPAMLASARAEGRLIERGAWRFLAVGETYVALYTATQASPGGYAPSVGFLEVVDRREFPTLAAFADRVGQLNGDRRFAHYGPNRYVTTRGHAIDFVMADPPKRPLPARLLPKAVAGLLGRTLPGPLGRLFADHGPRPARVDQWLIRGVTEADGRKRPIETDFDRWPLIATRALADGAPAPVRADGTGQVIVDNGAAGSLLLSLADPQQPIRMPQAGPVVDLARAAKVAGASAGERVDLTLELAGAQPVGYFSLPWAEGSRPDDVQVLVKRGGAWQVAARRTDPHVAEGRAFRTEFDLTAAGPVEAIRVVATGRALALAGRPEAYRRS